MLALFAALLSWSLATSVQEKEQCTTDTFGMAGEDWPRPSAPGVEQLKCEFQYTDAALLKDFTLVYYPTTQAFADYQGYDMVPETHHEFDAHYQPLELWVPGVNGPQKQIQRIKLADCDIPTPDGGSYRIQRVGPLVSTGAYDYWQFGWRDVWHLSNVLAEHPEGIMFTHSFSGPVDSAGNVLGHPPIHIHHIHITPTPGVVTKLRSADCMSGMNPEMCYLAHLVVEQHGDYQCTEQDGGIDCFFEVTGQGTAKVLRRPLDLEGEINDVRAPDSESMTWWYQAVIRWFPIKTSLRPLSQHFMVGPGWHKPGDQRHNVFVFPVNTRERAMYWYSGTMEQDGALVRNKLHAHNTMFEEAYFFRAAPEDLGIGGYQFYPAMSYVPLLLKDLGFGRSEDVVQLILGNLSQSSARYGRSCPPSQKRCGHGRPSLVCHSWVSNEDFLDPASGRTFAYDRRAPCCCKPWEFRKGDIFTVVAFMTPMKTAPGPWSPEFLPATGNMHVHWLMTYATPDNESHYGMTMYAQNHEKQVEWHDAEHFPVWRLLEFQQFGAYGIYNLRLGLMQKLWILSEWLLLVVIPAFGDSIFAHIVWLACALVVVGLHCVIHLRTWKSARDHPAVVCAEQTSCCPDGMSAVTVEALKYGGSLGHDA